MSLVIFSLINKKASDFSLALSLYMAGVAGFEPTHNGVKVRCLTAWRHPNILRLKKAYWLYYFMVRRERLELSRLGH